MKNQSKIEQKWTLKPSGGVLAIKRAGEGSRDAHLEGSRKLLGPSWKPLGSSWGPLEGILGASWGPFGPVLGALDGVSRASGTLLVRRKRRWTKRSPFFGYSWISRMAKQLLILQGFLHIGIFDLGSIMMATGRPKKTRI